MLGKGRRLKSQSGSVKFWFAGRAGMVPGLALYRSAAITVVRETQSQDPAGLSVEHEVSQNDSNGSLG